MVRTAITKEELTKELRYLRKRVAELETLEALQQESEKQLLKFTSEQKYRTVFESANDIIILMDNKGKVIDVNDKLTEILGYKKEKLEGKNLNTLTDILTEKSLDMILTNIKKRLAGEQVPPYEIEMAHKNGAWITLEVNAQAMKKDGRIVGDLAILRDITERRKSEEAIRISEEKFRNSMDSSPLSIRIVDEDGNTAYANQAMLDVYGYENINELNATRTRDRYTPESYAEHVLRVEKRQHGEPVSPKYEVSIVRKDGTIRHLQVFRKEVLWEGKKQYQVLYNDITEQKRVEEALKNSEERFRRIAENARDLIYRCRVGDDRSFEYVSRSSTRITGYTPEEFYADPDLLFRLIHPEDRQLMESVWNNLAEYRDKAIISRWIRKDGRIDWIEQRSTYIVDDKGEVVAVQGIARDVTEREEAERAFRESSARFRELARLLPQSIWETDENGIITYTNQKTIEIYGYSHEDTKPSSYLDNLIPEDRERAVKNTQKILQGKILEGIPYTALRKDGSVFPVIIYASAIVKNGKGVGLRGVTIDVTEQKMGEKRMEQAAQEWRTTFDSLTDMVCIIGNDFRINRVNRAYANMLNKEPQELLGKVCYELIHNADCPHSDCPHQQTMRTGKPAAAEFYESCLKTYVEVSTSPVFDENGNIKSSVHVIRDISERKHMEQQLMLTDRLASVGELASGVAHELNNPLTSVIGFSQLLMEGEVPDSIKEDLNLINSEAQRAASIVKNLLTFARKHAAVKQATRINNLIEDVLKLRAYEHKVNNIEVIRNFTPDIPEIMVDYFQIQQVFLNLIINAEFFMSEAHQKGVLTISTERVRNSIRISFTDDGPGIATDNLSRIFDPFFTTKEVGKGTGLGLSICHGIVTEHGGTIYAESEVGKGTTFHIELPVHSQSDKVGE